MNKSQPSTTEKNEEFSQSQNNRPNQKDSSSTAATEQAKKGEPLNADKPRDRSPKQENL